MQLLFGNAPTNASFDAKLLTFEEPLRQEYRLKLCRLAFGYYDKLPVPFRKFTDKYMKHNRALYVDYLIHHTPIAGLRYSLQNPGMLIQILHILENANNQGRIMYHHLASCLLIIFDYPYELNTLGDYICRSVPTAEGIKDFFELIGRIKINGEEITVPFGNRF